MTQRAEVTTAVIVIFIAIAIMLLMVSCAPPPATINPQARYLTSSTSPICLFLCTTVVTSNEAAQFPELRRAGDASGNSKTSSSTSSVSNP